MKNFILQLFFIILFSSSMNAQHAGGGFSGKSYVLHGETEIVLKNGQKISSNDQIDGAKIEKNGINYQDVDYIRLVKTNLKGFEHHNGTIYKYVIVKKKPQLVKVIIESPKLSFYQERPRMTGGGYSAFGVFQQHGTSTKLYMVKDGDNNAIEANFGKKAKNIPTLFPECPRLKQYQKDKEMRELLSLAGIIHIYNNNCEEASAEDMKSDKEVISASEPNK